MNVYICMFAYTHSECLKTTLHLLADGLHYILQQLLDHICIS